MHAGLATHAAASIFVVVAAACTPSVPPPAPLVVAWRDRVPTAAPDAVAAQPVVTTGPATITLLPISPSGALVGISYAYDMPHCGINGAIDVDGSFWDAVGIAPNSVDFDGQAGRIRLTSPNEADFTADNGRVVHLIRHAGPKAIPYCR